MLSTSVRSVYVPSKISCIVISLGSSRKSTKSFFLPFLTTATTVKTSLPSTTCITVQLVILTEWRLATATQLRTLTSSTLTTTSTIPTPEIQSTTSSGQSVCKKLTVSYVASRSNICLSKFPCTKSTSLMDSCKTGRSRMKFFI